MAARPELKTSPSPAPSTPPPPPASLSLPRSPIPAQVYSPIIQQRYQSAALLADAAAIRRALALPKNPALPDQPESLPAPREDRKNNPKTALAVLATSAKQELSVAEKEGIAAAMNDMALVRTRCPQGFAPFADEVQQHISPLF